VSLALMGVCCFWPHKIIGLEGLGTNQALEAAVLAGAPSVITSHSECGLQLSAGALPSCGRIVLFLREQGRNPGLVGLSGPVS
jgi:hypothetical protein